jgi:hypothetical protein
VDFRPLNDNVFHPAVIDVAEQLREADLLRTGIVARILKQREQRQQQQNDDDPQGEIAQIGVHLDSLDRESARHREPVTCSQIVAASRPRFT